MSSIRAKQIQALAWAVLTTVALVLPGRPDDELPGWIPESLEPIADKLVHTLLFFVLVILLHRAVTQETGTQESRSRGWFLSILVSTGILVVVLEIAQLWVPHRMFEPLDILAGLAGALAAGVVIVAKYR